jgi:hypothetical protein
MADPKSRRQDATCMAPTGPDDAEFGSPEWTTCGKAATQERVINGVVFPLCAEHAQEVDDDPDVESSEE